MLSLSLVIPCYNEAKNLPLLIERCSALTAMRCGIEVILVDNGSQDENPEVLAEHLPRVPACRAVRVPVNNGYGYGILAGLRAARSDILGWTYADMQTDPMDALNGLALFDSASHPEQLFVKGHRHGRPISDTIFTASMSIFETILLGRLLWDINAQPTMFHRRFIETWTAPPDDFALDLFAYYSARRGALNVKRFPVLFGERAHGTSHWNVNWAAKTRFIRRTVDYSFRLR